MSSNAPAKTWIKRILLPTDGSECAGRAANVAIEVARKFDAELIVLYVIAVPATAVAKAGLSYGHEVALKEYFESAHKEADKIVDKVIRLAKAKDVKATRLIRDYAVSVVETILEEATKSNVDLIVLGTRGLTRFKKLLIGSVSSGVVNHAHCSVLIVR
ncbi:MAG TPA: universal stress protein [Candidatus Acidoferrum sp.]|nr:universal stress protein [Candidatus Acidoferrum sp.]